MKSAALIFLILFFHWTAWAIPPGHDLDRPLILGPQFPLFYTTSTFEPDTAFNLKEGKSFMAMDAIRMNTYVFSYNNTFYHNPVYLHIPGSKDTFLNITNIGYSTYYDGEFNRHLVRWHYGWSNTTEVQLVFRELKISAGTLDQTVENFHDFTNLFNQYREMTQQNLLNIYIYDNATQQLIYKFTAPTQGYLQESMSLALKWQLKRTKSEAFSLTLRSNFNDYQIERGFNELADTRTHQNFNDANLTLNYSSMFEKATLNAAVSVTNKGNSLLANSPNEIYYFFFGYTRHSSKNLDYVVQLLQYNSPFPADGLTQSGNDVKEITMGFRWLLWNKWAFSAGFVENQDYGPNNIDIAFFSNLNTSF